MSTEEKGCGIDLMHILYLGGLLIEALRNLQNDFINNCSFANELMSRSSYIRVIELRDKFDQAVLLTKERAFF